jgi:Kdo2-lipid IVA lauroyltransferase/acyltransferase
MTEIQVAPEERRLPLSRRFRYLAEAAGFFAMIGLFRLLGLDRASAFGGWLGRNIAAPSRMSRLARANLEASFPEKSTGEIDAILRGMWDNLGRVLGEYAHLDKLKWDGPNPRIEVSGIEKAQPSLVPGKGILLISAHFANWEVMPFMANSYGLKGAIVVRPTNNPYVNRWLERVRTRNGLPEVISKGASGLRRIFALLRGGDAVCMLVDQRTSEGIPAPFFGRDALTTPAPAALALKLGAIIVPISNERVGGARFHVRVHPAIPVPNTGDADRDLLEMTAAINGFVEERVRAHPEQWLWIHRRWVDANAPLRKRAQALLERGGAASAASRRV